VIIRIACVLARVAVLYALFVLALVAALRKTDVRAHDCRALCRAPGLRAHG
jgi:hypothetical protein